MIIRHVSPGEVQKAYDRTSYAAKLVGEGLKGLIYHAVLWDGWIEHEHYAVQARKDGGMNIYFLMNGEPVTKDMQDPLK